jgi:hypothetical protein
MTAKLTDRAAAILNSAQREARTLRHDYVGTEHLLLALTAERGGLEAEVLAAVGVSSENVSLAVEALIAPGPQGNPTAHLQVELPLTPRAELARDEAGWMGQSQIEPEHLLLGLIREREGVAGQVLAQLGVTPERVRAEALKYRVLQMTIVERAVRPVRASAPWKRKRREELLAHLSAIFDVELAERRDPADAVQAAAERFGDPAELASELQSAVPWNERVTWAVERWLGWRAPESASRYLFRVAAILGTLLASVAGSAVLLATLLDGGGPSLTALWPGAALTAVVPLNVFVLGLLYFKIRDAHFGVFGMPRSRRVAALLSVAFGAFALIGSVAYLAVATNLWELLWSGTATGGGDVAQILLPSIAASLVLAVGAFVVARRHGPTEIRDTMWQCLDLGEPARESC